MIRDEDILSEDFVDVCALRFDGYKYAETCGNRMGPDLVPFPQLVERIEETSELYEDPLVNLAVFFALQRGLGKWGGEQLPANHPARSMFRFLFLHLYLAEIPERFQFQPYYRDWTIKYKPSREMLAAHVRNRFALIIPE